MKVNESKITINGTEFTVKEPTVKTILPLLPRLSGDDPSVVQEAQLELISICVWADGKLYTLEELNNSGISAYMKLTEEVMKVTGLSGKEGKD
jgi:hypothetical protein